ncbi:MAG: hypothetical protein IKH04_00275 [Kiritimatiellae bacterium]|nr:hypothetical protein [Kiritimatiellia bacterium]
MRQNRRRYARTSAINHRLAVIFSLFVLVIALGAFSILSINATIARTGKEIAALEAELKTIRAERIRAEARWSACTRPEQLDAALARHGLRMSLASGEKIVSLRGRPAPKAFWSSMTEVAANGTVPRK